MQALKAENAALRARLEELQEPSAPPNSPAESAAGAATAAEASAPVLEVTAPPAVTATSLESGIAWPTQGERFWERKPRNSVLTLEDNSPCSAREVPPDANPLSVVHLTAEMAPLAKVREVDPVRVALEGGAKVGA